MRSQVDYVCTVKGNRKWLRESVILPRIFIYIFHRTSRAYLPFSFVVIQRNINNGHTVWLRDGSRCLDCTCTLRYCDCHQSRELFRDIFQICPRLYVWLSRITQRFADYDIYPASTMLSSAFCTVELENVLWIHIIPLMCKLIIHEFFTAFCDNFFIAKSNHFLKKVCLIIKWHMDYFIIFFIFFYSDYSFL